MTLTKRGNRVVGVGILSIILASMFIAGRFDAMDQCTKFQADNNYTAAIDAGCSLDILPNGEYPYQWTP
jgi:hypothetical protein